MKPIKPIAVEVPTSEARRDRVEREVFARLDAMRDVEHANQIAPIRGRRLPLIAAGFAFAAAAASVVFLVTREPPPVPPASPSLVVTPAGGSSRFTVGDAVIDAGSDTSVEVKHDADGTTTLVLARGSVDCDVEPRPGRAPFRVVAGDVSVEVIGTRFEVSRTGKVTRVDVARGKVKVHGNGEQRLLGAGESWTSGVTTAAVAPAGTLPAAPDTVGVEDQPEASDDLELPPDPVRRPRSLSPPAAAPPATSPGGSGSAPAARSPQQAYEAALEIRDEARRARAFRAVANGSHAWAALSLFNLAELQARTDVDATLATLDELKRRFPRAGNAEDAAWFRVDVLRDARRKDEARKAAADYLRDFPHGTYAKLAARLVRPSSP